MESERVSTPVPYEPPAVESRERIDAPLVATVGSNVITAAFHPIDDAPSG